MLSEIIIYLLQKAQITVLLQNKAFIKGLIKYSNFANIFLEKKTLVLLKQTNFNKYTIKLKNDKQLFYLLIYNLSLVKLKTLKVYIKTYLKIKLIQHFKFLINVIILFDKKSNSNFSLYIDY